MKKYRKYTTLFIHGGCIGVDLIGVQVAKKLGFDILSMPANWKKYGRAAGPKRNIDMVDSVLQYKNNGISTIVLAFHDNLDMSKGTKHCVNYAKKKGLKVILHEH